MRTLLIATALLAATAAQAEPKHSVRDPAKPSAAKEAPAQDFQPRVIETKAIELATPDFEVQTKDVSDSALDRKLASRKAKMVVTGASVMREPPKLPSDEPAEAPNAAPSAATSASKP